MSVRQRAAVMLRLHDLVLEQQVALMDTIQADTGKSRRSAFDEVMDVAINARHYARRAPSLLRTCRRKGALPVLTSTTVSREPWGVVGIISPWNYPLTLVLSDAIPALLAGNSVVIKPDEKTEATARLAVQLAHDAGVPVDALRLVCGSGPEAGGWVADNCDYLMFTGSTATGRILGERAGKRLIPFSAELGGKNPMVVLDSADVSRAARCAVEACFTSSGQLCVSIERIIVLEEVYDAFRDAFVEAVSRMRVGATGWDVDMGALITPEHTERMKDFVDDAVGRGARVLTGGFTLPSPVEGMEGRLYAPTVLEAVPSDARLFKEEVFGPVVYLQSASTMAEAIALANDTEYGLNASVWGAPSQARRVAQQLQAGTVNINDGYAAAFGSVDAPMGGWKSSGVGRRHGDVGLLEFTQSRTIAQQRVATISEISAALGPETMGRLLKLGKRLL